MVYSKKENLTTIDEIYAIGPAISILMEGYVFIEQCKRDSAEVMLVPAEEKMFKQSQPLDWVLRIISFPGGVRPSLKILIKIIAWVI